MARKDRSYRRRFAAGANVFAAGEPGDVTYLIETGRIEIRPDDDATVRETSTLGPGEIVGEMALIDDAPRTETATARVASECLVIDRDLLRERIGTADPMIRMLMRALLDRLRPPPPASTAPPADQSGEPNRTAREFGDGERRAIGQFKFEDELKRGLNDGEFELTLQPIVRLDGFQIVGFEALMAWRHPTRGRLAPASFLAMAERSGLVRDLDELALRSAIRALKGMRRDLGSRAAELKLSVNLSGVNADDQATVQRLRQLLAEEAFDARFLTLEITESWLVSNPEQAQDILVGLKELGFGLALDDFGTGYSSLAYLHRFPMDYLKIDRSFTRDILTSPGSAKIVRAVIGLAHTFGLQAIAEGIDDPGQIAPLLGMDCEFGQGYHFGRPLDTVQARRLLLG